MKILSINKEHTKNAKEVAFNVDCLPSGDVVAKSNEKISEKRDILKLFKIDADNKCFYIRCTSVPLSTKVIDSIVTIVIESKAEIQNNIVDENNKRESMFKELEESLKLPVKYSFSSR
jgi:hypothetical protein